MKKIKLLVKFWETLYIQSDLVAALIISLHFLTVILDVLIGGIILLIYRQKNNMRFVNWY